MTKDEICTPSDKIDKKIDERKVLTLETNALNSLRKNKKTNELEKRLAKEYYDYLDNKVNICDKEIYRIFYEEIPVDSPDRANILDKIESEEVELWTYKSEIKVVPNPLNMTLEAYKALSYREKVDRKITEDKVLSAGVRAITKVNESIKKGKAKNISEYEAKLLQEREYELKGLILASINEIWRLDWDVIPQDAPDRTEILDKIEAAAMTKSRYDSINNSRKILVKTCLS